MIVAVGGLKRAKKRGMRCTGDLDDYFVRRQDELRVPKLSH